MFVHFHEFPSLFISVLISRAECWLLVLAAGAGALVSLYTAAASSFVVCSFRDFRCQTLLCGQVLVIINNNLSFHPLTTCRCQESARLAGSWWQDYRQNMALPRIMARGRRDHRHMHIFTATATAAGWVAC